MENTGEKSLKVVENNVATKGKKIYIEVLRCIAIFFVIFNHTEEYGFDLYKETAETLPYIIYLTISILCKAAVPIFFMISGAMLLGKEESIKTLYKKRVLRFLIVIIVVSACIVLYAVNDITIIFYKEMIGIFLSTIYQNPILYTYWFLYAYLGFLIMLPILRNLVKNMKKETYYYLFAVYGVCKLGLPILEQIAHINLSDNLAMNLLEINILCPIVGYYLEHVLDIKSIDKNMKILGTIIVCIIIVLAGILTTLRNPQLDNQNEETYIGYGSVVIAAYVFILIKAIFNNKKLPKILNKIILIIGGCSFGIYLEENMLRKIMLDKIVQPLSPVISTLPACIIAIICIICVGTIITFILKKIPYIKKLL